MTMRKLIPCNIVMVLVCLVSILSLLFFPILTVDVGTVAASMASEGGSGADEVASYMDMKISLTTVSLGKIATAEDKGTAFLTEFVLKKDGAVEKGVLNGIARSALSSVDSETFGKIDVAKLNNILYKLEGANADADAVSAEYAETLNAELTRVGAEPIDAGEVSDGVREFYDKVTEHTGGAFSVEALICLASTGFAEDSPTDYEALAEKLSSGEAISGGEEGSPLSGISEMISTVASYDGYIGYGFYAMLAFLLPWGIFLLIGTLRIFLRNKRAATWYVFAFGWLPCILFWALPKLAGLILPMIMGEGGPIVPMLAAIGSYAWISGICLVVMWLLWLVWMRPLKKKAKSELY